MSFYKTYLHIIFFTMATCTLFFTQIALAEKYQLELIVDLNEINNASTDAIWLNPLTNPADGDEFFVAQNNGLILLVDKYNKANQKTILNLPLWANEPAFISLTAIAIHPNFANPEKPGYATLYTAHTTAFEEEKNSSRSTLHDTSIDFPFAFETLITAWQFDFDEQKIDPQTKREILSIPIKDQSIAIKQLAFDPYQKSWNTDYGQLYFSLRYIDELQYHPLYSGVILRISPLAFGSRNYTVSQTNPFIKNSEVIDEIVVMGGQNIEHFFWAKNNHASIFIQHSSSQQYQLTKAKLGDNLLIPSNSNFLWPQSAAMSSTLLYQGRNFPNLRNKMVFFSLLDNQWYLTSFALSPLEEESPISEKLITKELLSSNSYLNIYQDKQGEIVLFDNDKNRLYSLQSADKDIIKAVASQSNISGARINHNAIYISLLVVLFSLWFFVNRKSAVQKKSRHVFEKKHVRFEYEQTTQSILLFRAKQKSADKTLSIDNIIRCEVLLNKSVINTIDGQLNNAINNQIEEQIRALFTKEKNDKMVDEKTRQIGMILSDKDNNYTVHLYLRKGNNRITNITFDEAVDMLMDLCWVISKRITPQITETRLIPIVVSSRKTIPAAPRKTSVAQSISNDNHSNKVSAKPQSMDTKPISQSTQQNEVVEALEKLVNLHQQGYLTDEEFSLAKIKLLQ